MKHILLALWFSIAALNAADTNANKALLDDLAQKAKALAYAVPPAEKLLPADTLGFVTVPDWSKAEANFTNSATGQLWSDPAMKAFKEAFLDKLNKERLAPLEKELGFQFTNFLQLARGQFTIGVVPNGWDGRSEKQPGILWLVDSKENAPLLRTNLAELRKKWTDAGRKMRTDKIRDVEFTTVIVDAQEMSKSLQRLTPGPRATPQAEEEVVTRTVEWVIGQSGSLLIVSDAAKDVEKLLASLSGAAVPVVAEQAAFTPSAGMVRNAQTFAWVNVKPIMTTLARKPADKQAEQQSLFGPMPTVDRLLNAFGLNGVQTIAFNVVQGGEGSTGNIAVRVPESARKGLFNILAVDPKDASAPPFVPADAVKFSRWRIDLQKAWTTIENMLVEVSPQYAGFSKLILDTAGKDRDPNFDFRKQLLANMGDDVITYEKAVRGAGPNATAPSITLVGSKNAEQMAASLRAVTSIFPPDSIKYSERDFLGRKVYSVVIPAMGPEAKPRPLSYAASGGYVAFSSDVGALEEYLRSGEGNLKPLRDTVGLNNAAQSVGGTGNGYFSYDNLAETARTAFDAAKTNPAGVADVLGAGQLMAVLSMMGGNAQSAGELVEPSKLPPFAQIARYFHFDVSAIQVSPDAITFRTFTPTPPSLKK